MKPVQVFQVLPSLPKALEGLLRLAHNLRWAWDFDAIELFRRLDSDLWDNTLHNPVLMLGQIDQARLEAAARDDAFLAHLDRVLRDEESYLSADSSWYARAHGKATTQPLVAYFSAEFGLTECMSIFAGGLGVLAGDHLKSASDLGVPLVGVGLLYQQGYFRQYLNAAGWQQEAYEDNDFHNLPLTPENRKTVQVQFPGRIVTARVWRVQVGRVTLFLLDTNIPANNPSDRDITDQLYSGDHEMRIQQEILLGIGGYRALEVLGLQPEVYHMNEGHSAFLALERVQRLMEAKRLSFDEARVLASAGLIFTTHTPVMAGHDYFPPSLVDRYFSEYIPKLGISRREFLGLGRQNPANDREDFCMTVLALRLASFNNGVSRLHGKVSRAMWKNIWPGVPENEIPIQHVTNGVHFRSWISHEMNSLYDRYLGPQWSEGSDHKIWQRVESIPAEELWRTHERRRERLVVFARRRLRAQLTRRGAPQADIESADEVLDAGALTIGFARRFASYKRATLIRKDLERLAAMLNNAGRPVQILYAGKAHPHDHGGKELIQQIVALSARPEFRRRIVFLEEYDMVIARYLVQGVDVWLNNPMRPMEASGTSGMKAMANGALNLSTLDGWWDEAWQLAQHGRASFGWAIGQAESYDNPEYQDKVESEALYDLLERDVIPTFYDRGTHTLPRRWVARMKSSIATLAPIFNMHRVVREYTDGYYRAAASRFQHLASENCEGVRSLTSWMAGMRQAWSNVHVDLVESGLPEFPVGTQVPVRARVHLGPIKPDDVTVELYAGRLNAQREFVDPVAFPMRPTGKVVDGGITFELPELPCTTSGLHGYTVRVLPRHPELATFYAGLITWAGQDVKVAALV